MAGPYLVIGNPNDLCCSRLREALDARGHATCEIANPLAENLLFRWRLNNDESGSELSLDGQTIRGNEIAGVFVGQRRYLDPRQWEPSDLDYMQAEMEAGLLAWLWSLPCQVVNRYRASNWYSPQPPLLAWQTMLQRCGLRIPHALVTNVEHEARAFGQRLADEGIAGAVYGPLTSPSRYLISTSADWEQLFRMQAVATVCLSVPHGEARLACMVGGRVMWGRRPSSPMKSLEPSLLRFAQLAGLLFVEVALAEAAGEDCVISVDPFPSLEHFAEDVQREIVESLADLLTGDEAAELSATAQSSWRCQS
jgi:hypothetical protein